MKLKLYKGPHPTGEPNPSFMLPPNHIGIVMTVLLEYSDELKEVIDNYGSIEIQLKPSNKNGKL